MTEPVARKPDFRRKLLLGIAGLLAVTASVAFGQANAVQSQAAPQAGNTAAKIPEFEVASIKPDKSAGGMSRIMFTPDGFSATNIPMKMLISETYQIRQDLISGEPGWVNSARYDIEAKVAGPDVAGLRNLSFDQRRSMLQPLLEDRFKLKVRQETKQLPIYELVIAKNGPKLKEAKPGDTYPDGIKGPDGVAHPGMMMMGRGQLKGQALPMTFIVRTLSQQLQRTVVDKTGLTGKYDIALKWAPDEGPGPMPPGPMPPGPVPPGPGGGQKGADSSPPPDSGPSIFTAIQEQLGLKLESTKGPVETLVIDHVEPPSEN